MDTGDSEDTALACDDVVQDWRWAVNSRSASFAEHDMLGDY
eukprot:CAMPEP_0170495958 /NCGR_PEP_ID=MMETSP0208-20121228/19496_1 /TAXON_ID=197538 /ORGANISM="Strombidium inclinatum, Strain S3" /LENGTH=40 /DNA_ID= /DNA_START= /DNA_END= /DNA_ORIENTATION=